MEKKTYLSELVIQFLLSFDFQLDVVEDIEHTKIASSVIESLTLRVARLEE